MQGIFLIITILNEKKINSVRAISSDQTKSYPYLFWPKSSLPHRAAVKTRKNVEGSLRQDGRHLCWPRVCQANFDLFIITPYGDYQRLIKNAPSRFKETGGFEWACIFKSFRG